MNNLLKVPNSSSANVPHLLAWGYELKIKAIKKCKFFFDFNLNQLGHDVLVALWEAIRISGVSSIQNLKIVNQSNEAWVNSCCGLSKSQSLTALHLASGDDQFSDVSWQLF